MLHAPQEFKQGQTCNYNTLSSKGTCEEPSEEDRAERDSERVADGWVEMDKLERQERRASN